MSAFTDYYLVDVENCLGRETKDYEENISKQLYIEGWHPRRTSNALSLVYVFLTNLNSISEKYQFGVGLPSSEDATKEIEIILLDFIRKIG